MKPLLSIAFLMLFCFSAQSQSKFVNSIGASTVGGYSSWESVTYFMAQFTYAPRFNLTEMSNSSISLTFPTSAGAGVSEDGVVYGGGIRSLAEINFGRGALYESDSRVGFHIGGGFGVGYTGADIIDEGLTFGPVLRTGIRFAIGERTMGMALFYQKGLEEVKWHTFGVNILVDL
jgi:hypothetical protein